MACTDAIKLYVDHMQKQEPTKIHKVRFVYVMNGPILVAEYGEGQITSFNPPLLSGSGFVYRNNERWGFPASPGEMFQPPKKNPFDPLRRDPVSITINANTGVITVGPSSIQATCEKGVLYGFIQGSLFGGMQMYIVALANISEDIPDIPS